MPQCSARSDYRRADTGDANFCAPQIIAKLSTVVRAALELKEVREKLLAQGLDPSWTSPEEFGAYLKSETEKWSRVARDARVVAE